MYHLKGLSGFRKLGKSWNWHKIEKKTLFTHTGKVDTRYIDCGRSMPRWSTLL